MKRVFALITACLLIALTVCSCSEKEKTSAPNGATEDEANYPTPEKNMFSESGGETGMRINLTLDRFTNEFNTMYESLGGSHTDYPYKKWKSQGTEKSVDNGLNYEYYSLTNGKITLTATVEEESRELINVGCGITVKNFYKSQNDEQQTLTLCGIIAAVSGGYSSDSVPFFENLYVDTISDPEHCFWYNNAIYLYERKQNREESVMFFRTMPAVEDIKKRWNIEDYKEHWLG